MNKFHHVKSCCSFLAAGVALLASLGVQAELRLEIPSETFGPPFYARMHDDPALTPNNGKWVGVIKYRQRECIPDDFNLFGFDVPAAFFCPLNNLTGYEVWETQPGVDPAPMHMRMTGDGPVPVWFVRMDEFQQAAADGVVTIADLEAMPSLMVGTADFFDELLRPSESNPSGFVHITARGSFENGDRFRLTHTISGAFGPEYGNLTRSVRTNIEFRGEGAVDGDHPLAFPYTGHWTDLSNPGQGLGIHPVRATDYIFGTFYAIDESGQQVWYALDGTDFDGVRAEFSVLLSHGADANAPNGVLLEQVGQMSIEFLGCRTARANYTINGNEGAMSLVSLVSADDCTD